MTAEPILAIDTATSIAVVALGDGGELVAEDVWAAGYRHGEELLVRIGRLLAGRGLEPTDIAAVVVGTGPGAFTGLRVGIATAKGLAHAIGRPIVGVSTAEALIAAAAETSGGRVTLLLPAGPSDRTLVRAGEPARLLSGGTEPDVRSGDVVVAVDLDGRAAGDALESGTQARGRLGATLIRLGTSRLATTGPDDLARLVPDYVTLPRGIRASAGQVTWSRDPH